MMFSVLMSVYNKEQAEYLHNALKSIDKNTARPDEVVLVEDGPLNNELYHVIEEFRKTLNIISVKNEKNMGLGYSLNKGIVLCKNEIVARCDSDDVNKRYRFEYQLKVFESDKDMAIISGWVQEFNKKIGDTKKIRKVPEAIGLYEYSRHRSPFNHPCVMFKKEAVIQSGGYKGEYLYEDYSLWLRMIKNKYKGDNLQQVLVDMRVGDGLYARRGGIKYAVSEIKAQYMFYKNKYIGLGDMFYNIIVRAPIRVIPVYFRKKIYISLLRK
jgi:UDP-Gal:alpha-D-GlcNAc-diphosphoundecaprenol beta-1,3-galactosyltransferase